MINVADYKPYVEGMPGLLSFEILPPYKPVGLPLGRFTFAIYETDAERERIIADTMQSESFSVALAYWHHTPTAHLGETTTFYMYPPPLEGWPWYLVVRWPTAHAEKMMLGDAEAMNRLRYTVETYATEKEATSDTRNLMMSLDRKGYTGQVISPEMVSRHVGG